MQDRLSGRVFAFYTRRVLAALLLLAYAPMASAAQGAIDPNIYLARNSGFCSPGAFEPIPLSPGQPADLKVWGSFCKEGDKVTGSAETSAFTAPQAFGIYLAGYASTPGLTLEIENLSKHARLAIMPRVAAGEQWRDYNVRLPASWRGNLVRLVAHDANTDVRGWFAFTEPVASNGTAAGFSEANRILLRTVLYFALTIMPALAVGTLAIRRGLRDLVLVGLAELGAIGISGHLGFCLWFIAPKLGHFYSFLLPIGTAGWFAWNYWHLDVSGRKIVRRLFWALGLPGVAALLIASLGFVYGGLDKPLQTASERFSHPLPGDNRIPYLFAEALKEGHRIPKFEGNWLPSDRPPLQTGLVLSEYTYTSAPRDFDYTIISIILQSLWIFAAWLLLTAFGLDGRPIALVLAVCLFSGFVFLNSFYVWPKLLAAAYILAALAVLLTPKFFLLISSSLASVLTGAMLAFAMLSHGGSAFAIIGIALTMMIVRRYVPVKRLLTIVMTALVLYIPWTLYQKFCCPPGDRLLKMHLAGRVNVDPRPFVKTLISAYGALTPGQILRNKAANVNRIFVNEGRFWTETAHLVGHIRKGESLGLASAGLRGWMFFNFAINLGFLVLGPVTLLAGILKQYRTPEWRAAALLWVFIAVTIAAWCLLMFGPASTVIHQGTYSIILLAYAGSILAIWSLSRALALVIASLQVLLNVLLYVAFMQAPPPNAVLAEPPLLLGCLILCALSVPCIVWLLIRSCNIGFHSRSGRRVEDLAFAFGPSNRT